MAVRFDALTKTFGSVRAVSGIDLEVSPGQVFGFLGPNGAGKSTTIRMMLGLYRPTSGQATVLGRDVATHGVEVRRRIGYLPGELALFPRLTGGSVLYRVARIRGDVDPAARAMLEWRFGAQLDRPLRTLSKGNRQKIGLVQAFMHRPDLLVLDEPTSGLDPLLQKEFADLLEETVARGATVFLSSHDLDEVQRLAHQVAIIRDGVIVANDTVERLRARAPRTVEMAFREPVPAGLFDSAAGVTVMSRGERRVRVNVTASMEALFAAAAPYGILDVSARPADLDELFLSYYAAGAGHA